MPSGRHARLIEEDAAEVLAIGKDVGLERQEGATGIDEIDAGQPVLQRHLLRAQMLLDGDGVVGAAFHRRVVGDDHHVPAAHAADAGDQASAGRIAVVHVPGGERRQLEEGGSGVEQLRDPLADGELALIAMALQIFLAAAELSVRRRAIDTRSSSARIRSSFER